MSAFWEVGAGTEGWREVGGIAPVLGYRAGSLGDAPVVAQLGAPCVLATSARHERAIAASAAARGWLAREG